ncbi:Lipase_GDSL domain-containing protein, partial [Cephalotus follicularis]
IYDQGARNFWVHNTDPLRCLAQNIAKFGSDPSSLDRLGCTSEHILATKHLNLQLDVLYTKFRGRYTDSNITYVEISTIKSKLQTNCKLLSIRELFAGFEQLIMACCDCGYGYGGPPRNYDNRISCRQTKVVNGATITAQGCSGTENVNWDGTHYSEAANQYVSSQILTGKYYDPP